MTFFHWLWSILISSKDWATRFSWGSRYQLGGCAGAASQGESSQSQLEAWIGVACVLWALIASLKTFPIWMIITFHLCLKSWWTICETRIQLMNCEGDKHIALILGFGLLGLFGNIIWVILGWVAKSGALGLGFLGTCWTYCGQLPISGQRCLLRTWSWRSSMASLCGLGLASRKHVMELSQNFASQFNQFWINYHRNQVVIARLPSIGNNRVVPFWQKHSNDPFVPWLRASSSPCCQHASPWQKKVKETGGNSSKESWSKPRSEKANNIQLNWCDIEVIDVVAGKGFQCKPSQRLCPTLTRTRASQGGFWLTKLNRPLSPKVSWLHPIDSDSWAYRLLI